MICFSLAATGPQSKADLTQFTKVASRPGNVDHVYSDGEDPFRNGPHLAFSNQRFGYPNLGRPCTKPARIRLKALINRASWAPKHGRQLQHPLQAIPSVFGLQHRASLLSDPFNTPLPSGMDPSDPRASIRAYKFGLGRPLKRKWSSRLRITQPNICDFKCQPQVTPITWLCFFIGGTFWWT